MTYIVRGIKHISLVLVVMLMVGCGGSGDNPEEKQTGYTVLSLVNDGNQTVDLGEDSSSAYILFTNHGNKNMTPVIEILNQSSKKLHRKHHQDDYKTIPKHYPFTHGHYGPKIEALKQRVLRKTQSSPSLHTDQTQRSDFKPLPEMGDARIFEYFYLWQIPAHARMVIKDTQTHFGKKSLVIWVADNVFGSDCNKSRCVTQSMVDALAPKFLKAGDDNDIYDWTTGIYGEEWGPDADGYDPHYDYIGETNQIHILLTDIDEDNKPSGGYIGMFGAVDMYKKSSISCSNEETMFYVDAVMFANGSEEGWSIDDPMPIEVVSTLVHEFLHMINFYQKRLRQAGGVWTEPWVEEILALATEDVMAVKARTNGLRAVSPDRGDAGDPEITWGYYPCFNQYNTIPVDTHYSSDWKSYCTWSSFGAYLVRNHGGAKLLHDIMHNPYTDERAIVDAVNRNRDGQQDGNLTLGDLIREWGIAVLLSDIDDLQAETPKYNIGDFFLSSYDGVDFLLGSINFFNYSPQPKTFTETQEIEPNANLYYKVGDNLSGEITFRIERGVGVEATLIIKPTNENL